MQKRVIEFFKRNPEALGCHLVLQEVFAFGNRAGAEAYAKSKNGMVTSVSKKEYDEWVEKNKPKETPTTKDKK